MPSTSPVGPSVRRRLRLCSCQEQRGGGGRRPLRQRRLDPAQPQQQALVGRVQAAQRGAVAPEVRGVLGTGVAADHALHPLQLRPQGRPHRTGVLGKTDPQPFESAARLFEQPFESAARLFDERAIHAKLHAADMLKTLSSCADNQLSLCSQC